MIICWDFPPHAAIGGRRWAKMAKSLLKRGYNISVITSELTESSKKLAWISQKELDKISVHYLHHHKLTNWLNDYSSPFKFFKIHLARLLLFSFFKGTIFDRAIGVEKCFLELARQLITENAITTVFVTGAPFNLVYYAARLKVIFPELKIVADYRDPWINAQNYGMKNLSVSKMRDEHAKQDYVFEQVDYITAPNSFLLQEIKESYTGVKGIQAKFVELPHAFDPDDVVQTIVPAKKDAKIKIIYGGTLYLGIDRYLELFNKAISQVRQNLKDRPLEVFFYTNESDKCLLFEENKDCVKFSKAVGDKIFDEVAGSDFILILLSEHNKNYVTSKYYEFLPYKKPYLYVGPEGFVSEKIEKEGFGYCLKEPGDLAEILRKNDVQKSSVEKELTHYTFDAVTGRLLNSIFNRE